MDFDDSMLPGDLARGDRLRVIEAIKAAPELLELPEGVREEALRVLVDELGNRRMKQRQALSLIEARKDEIVKGRRDVEQRWIDDINAYEGESTINVSKDHATDGDDRGPPKVNLTRARTRMAAARIADMLFPSNDRNWDIESVDDPVEALGGEMPVGQDGQPLPEVDLTHMVDERVDDLRDRVTRHLDASNYSEHGRDIVEDGCKIGIGVMKGPFNWRESKRRFQKQSDEAGNTAVVISKDERTVPRCKRVDPRFFYPEPVSTMGDCTRTYELHLMTAGQLRELAKQDGFDRVAASELLANNPDLGEVRTNLAAWNKRCCLKEAYDDRYAVWEMHGTLTKDEFEALGGEVDDDIDELPTVEVWFCQNEVLCIRLTVIEGDTRVPYFVWPYDPADDTIYGYGVPYLYRHPQRSLDSLWNMTLHNLSVSSGAQVFIRDGVVQPMDGKHQIRGPKLWRVKTDEIPVAEAFSSVIIPNNAEQLLQMIERTIELGDEEIALPAIAQGNPNEAVPTSSGLAQLLNASNIVQRRIAKSMDDEVITPLIERFVEWELLYGKGEVVNVNVMARGNSVLLHKDIKAQHLQVIAQLTADPRFAPYQDDYAFLQELYEAAEVPSRSLLLTREKAEEKIAQQQQAMQQAPDANAQAEIQLRQAKFEAEREDRARDDQFRERDRLMDNQERMAELADKAEERKARLLIGQMNLQMEAAKLAANEKIAANKIAATLQINDSNQAVKQMIASMDARLKAEGIARDEREMALKLNPANPTNTGI